RALCPRRPVAERKYPRRTPLGSEGRHQLSMSERNSCQPVAKAVLTKVIPAKRSDDACIKTHLAKEDLVLAVLQQRPRRLIATFLALFAPRLVANLNLGGGRRRPRSGGMRLRSETQNAAQRIFGLPGERP